MHARRYFVEAEPSDPRAVEALAFIRTLFAVEREIKEEWENLGDKFTDAYVVRVRRTRAGPSLAAFADWLDAQHRSATPKSLSGQAVGHARNQWATLVRYLDDARVAIDNNAAERAIRHGVIWHKQSHGPQSETGARYLANIWSIVETCRQQGRRTLEFLTDCLRGTSVGGDLPSLVTPMVSAQAA